MAGRGILGRLRGGKEGGPPPDAPARKPKPAPPPKEKAATDLAAEEQAKAEAEAKARAKAEAREARRQKEAAQRQLLAKVDALLAEDKPAEAAALLRPLADDETADRPAVIFLKLAKAYRNAGDLDAAEAVTEQGIAVHPAHAGLEISSAQMAMARENWGRAAERWGDLVDHAEGTAPVAAYLGLARARRRLGDLGGAVAAAEAGMAIYPDELAAEHHTASRLLATARLRTALVQDQAAVPVEEIVAAARANLDADDLKHALGLLTPALERLGDSAPPPVFSMLAEVQRREGGNGWRRMVTRGAMLYPDDIDLAILHARSAMSRDGWPLAGERWRALLDRSADLLPAQAFVDASTTFIKLRALDLAEHAAAEGRACFPDDPLVAVEHARVAALAFRWADAAERWQAVIEQFGRDFAEFSDHRIAGAGTALIEGGRPDEAIALMRHVRQLRGDWQLFLAVEGIALLRQAAFEQASEHWDEFWRRAVAGDPHFGQEQRLQYMRDRSGNDRAFAPAVPNDPLAEAPSRRWCVYTVVFGGYDTLKPPTYRPPGVDFICFSDTPIEAEGWEVRLVDLPAANYGLESRRYKIKPYDYLAGYDASLYVDGSVLIAGDVDILYRRWLNGKSFVAWRHPERSNLFHEIEAILAHRRHRPEPLIALYRRLREENLPPEHGLIEATILWRDHANADIRRLMDAWWDGVVATGGRDQPPLAYAMVKLGVRPQVMPPQLGICGANDFFRRLPHRGSPLDSDRDADDGEETLTLDRPPMPMVSRPAQTRRLVFVYRPDDVQTATMMRGRQLSDLAREAVEDWRIDYVDNDVAAGISDTVMIVTRSFLKAATADELAAFRQRGNIVCVDNVDHAARDTLHDQVDVYIASSMVQFIEYQKIYPAHEVHLITHHADPEIGDFTVPSDQARFGYFGELVNAAHQDELTGRVDFHQTNNEVVPDRSWLAQLPRYNVHYAVRQTRRGDIFKPFTKGFTAARCGANIIVEAREGDARYYVGNDYPFLLRDSSADAVREMIDYVADSFGGPEWNRGLDIMRSVRQRSSREHIGAELRAMLRKLQ